MSESLNVVDVGTFLTFSLAINIISRDEKDARIKGKDMNLRADSITHTHTHTFLFLSLLSVADAS